MDSHTPTKTLLQLMSFLLIEGGGKIEPLNELIYGSTVSKRKDSVSARLLVRRSRGGKTYSLVFLTVHTYTHPEKLLFVPHLMPATKTGGNKTAVKIMWRCSCCCKPGL